MTNATVLLDTLHLDNLSLRRKKFKAGLMLKLSEVTHLPIYKIFFKFVAQNIILGTLK